MWLRRLELTDVRSYAHADIGLEPGVSVLVGANAQGKTNLLEAVQRAATGSSHRVAGDQALVRAGAELGVIRCEATTDEGRRRTIEIEIGGGRRRHRVDGQDVRRVTDTLGVLRVVLFAPEDVGIVRGDPGERRRFLDDVLGQRRPAFAAVRGEYGRVLRQRNQLLKQARGLSGSARQSATATLQAWSEQLIEHGAQVTAARIAAVRALAGPVDRFYRELADRPEPVELTYRTTVGAPVVGSHGGGIPETGPLAQQLRDALDQRADHELARGMTLVGPHRDDLELSIGALPARTHASHGEVWSLALALKLASEEILGEVGDRPVVLLDDVFAELDVTRRQRLARACAGFDQVLVTAAVEQDVPLAGIRLEVRIEDGVSSVRRRDDAGAA